MRFILRNFFLACGLSAFGPRRVSAHVLLGQDLDGENANDDMGLGLSLSQDGMIVAIGADLNDGINGADSGHVRVLKWDDGTGMWEQLGDDIDGEAAGDWFGQSVSLSADGTIVAIGAPKNNGINGSDSGHVRVYQWNGTDNQWERLGQDIDGEGRLDWSGQTVSISADGTRLAIAAYRHNGARGHVRVYQWNDTSDQWGQLGPDIDGTAYESYGGGLNQGHAVSLSADGERVAIGAHNTNDRRGYVRVWQWGGNATDQWEKIGDDIGGEADYDQSGWAVSLSEDGARLAIGAPVNSAKGSTTGHVRVYQWDDADVQWGQLGQDIDGERYSDKSGYAISMSANGTRVAIGAPGNVGSGDQAGHVRIWDWSDDNDQWEQFGRDIDAEWVKDQSGSAVSISADGTRVAIGAPENRSGRGHVRVYEIGLPPPTESPTPRPTRMPSSHPTTGMPSSHPTGMPTLTRMPTSHPSGLPTSKPTPAPTPQPSMSPMPTTTSPTPQPAMPSTSAPTTSAPTMPTSMPTQLGTDSGAATLTTAALLPLALVGWGVALII